MPTHGTCITGHEKIVVVAQLYIAVSKGGPLMGSNYILADAKQS